jgi:hypothetical protein
MRSFILAITLLATAAYAAPTTAPSSRYLSALGVADAFLAAWVARDVDAGLALMSPRLRASHASDEPWVRQYMSGLSNPHHVSFEISRGKEMQRDRFVFPVILYEAYTGEPSGWAYRGSIEVIRHEERWGVDRLPRTSEAGK